MSCALAAILAVLSASPGPAAAEGTALVAQEQAIASQLQERLQRVLDGSLGAGKGAASVQVELEYEPKSRQVLDEAIDPPEPPTLGPNAPQAYILPGFKSKDPTAALGAKKPKDVGTVQAAALYGLRVKRTAVRLVLDPEVSVEAEDSLRAVVRDAMGFSEDRGDTLDVSRVRRPTAPKDPYELPARFAAPAVAAVLGVAALLGLAAFLVVAERWRRSASSSIERLAAAVETARSDRGEAEARSSREAVSPTAAGGGGVEAGDPLMFRVSEADAPRLCHLLKGQEAEDIALVLPFLEPDARRALLDSLPREKAAAAVQALAPVRFVDPDLLKTLKDEMERRLRGVIGGQDLVVALLRQTGADARGEILASLRSADPALEAQVRARVFIFEDLWKLSDEDLGAVLDAAPREAVAVVAASEPPERRERLSAPLSPTAREAFRQASELAGAPDAKALARARADLLAAADRLMERGALKPPSARLELLGDGQ